MLTNAILTALCYFGTFGYTNESPTLLNNRLEFNNYYDINMTLGGEVQHYHDRILVDCDFSLVPSEADPNADEVYVAFKSFTYEWYTISNVNDSETLANTYTNYYINFDDCVLNNPNNTWTLEHYNYRTSGNYAYWTTMFNYYDEYYDESCGISQEVNVFNPQSPLPSLTGTFRSNAFKVDLDDLERQVRNKFEVAMGGYTRGYDQGYADGTNNGKSIGYQTGYSDGYAEGANVDSTAFTIFNGILNIGMIPINFFLAMFDFTILGINISNFVMSVLSVFVTIWLIRMLTGKKTDGN